MLNSTNRHNFINAASEEFIEDNFAGEEINEIKNTITKTEIKSLLFGNDSKNVPKFNLKVSVHVYNELIIFPISDIKYDTITTNKFFINVHQLIKGKFHLDHSHITGEIRGYAHDFCNTMLIERKTYEIPLIAHNFFGFDLLYYMKAYIASAWGSKELNIGGNSLTQADYGNIKSEIKLINFYKFYQRNLGELSSTLTNTEKKYCQKDNRKKFKSTLLLFHSAAILKHSKKDKYLEIISTGKGIIPYELIINMEFFFYNARSRSLGKD